MLMKKLFQQSCLFLLLSVMTLGLAIGQDNSWRTTDDTRKVPLPPRDTSNDDVLVIAGGTLIDGSKGSAIENATLVIQGDRIIAVGRSGQVEIPDNVDRQIDASGLFIVPGLVDLHIHFTQQRGEDFARYRDSDAAAAIRGTLLLGQFLDAGITAVRDVGTRNDLAIRLKEAVERRLVYGVGS
jgi:imidazolonepropionase-like amidohydrolase